MIKPIKYFFWFVFESKRFTGMAYSQMIFKYGVIKRGICFARDMLEWDKAVKESGPPLAHIADLTALLSLTVYD